MDVVTAGESADDVVGELHVKVHGAPDGASGGFCGETLDVGDIAAEAADDVDGAGVQGLVRNGSRSLI